MRGKDRAGTGAPDCIRPARLAPSEPRRPVANRRSLHSPPGDRGSNRSLTLLSSHSNFRPASQWAPMCSTERSDGIRVGSHAMRIFKRILLGLVAAVLLLILLIFVVDPASWHWRVRREFLSILSAAKTTNELQSAVGHWGVLISLRDGSWIAIRYRDTHAGRIESLAIARDSGGSWFESDHHFCGAFSNYRVERQRQEEIRLEIAKTGDTNTVPEGSSGTSAILDAAFAAPSIEAGRKQLLKLGFQSLTK